MYNQTGHHSLLMTPARPHSAVRALVLLIVGGGSLLSFLVGQRVGHSMVAPALNNPPARAAATAGLGNRPPSDVSVTGSVVQVAGAPSVPTAAQVNVALNDTSPAATPTSAPAPAATPTATPADHSTPANKQGDSGGALDHLPKPHTSQKDHAGHGKKHD